MLNRKPTSLPIIPSLVVAALALLWAYWPTFEFMAEKWTGDPQYSHGFLVPVFSCYLLWRSYQAGTLHTGTGHPFLAAIVLGILLAVRWLAGGLMFHQLDALALLLSLVVTTLALGGWPLVRSCGPAILFLIFMIPLPFEIERSVGGPLKIVATQASTYLLQTFGLPAIAEGSLILIDDVRLGVVDACSGLKMLMTFSAFAVGAVLLLDRSRFEKLMVILGILPIAITVNVLRITATGVAHTITHDKSTLNFLHDLHGWLMMPAGLALLGVQLWCLSRLVVRPTVDETAFVPIRPVYA